MIHKLSSMKYLSIAVITAMAGLVLFGAQAVDAAIVNLPVSDPSFEDYSPTTSEEGGLFDYFTNISPEWNGNGGGNYIYDTAYDGDTTDPTAGVQAAHGYGSGYQWQATTSIYGSDGVDSLFTFSALIAHDDNSGALGDAILYLYDAGIDGTLTFNPGDVLASASFDPPNNSWTREEVTYDATGSAAEGNRVGIALFLDPEWTNGTAADDVLLTGPIAIPPAPQSALEIIVDRATGLITMDNTDVNADDIDIDYYRIGSTMGALDPTEGTGWNSLSDQNIDPVSGGNDPGETWDEAGGSSANVLSEAFLLGSSELSISETQGLGNAFAGTTGTDEDLIFQYAFDGGALEAGVVTYFGVYVVLDPGDFNGDLIVNGQDFLKWQREDGSPAGLLEWETNYGNDYSLSAATAAVPEPSSLTLLALSLLGIGYRRRRQR